MQRNYVTIRPLNREDSVLYFPPEAFGPFRVLHQIGAGTLGPVFRAYEPGRDRLVAVKVFRLDLTPEQAAALVAELDALVAAHLQHPHIAAPIAAGLEHGAAYLAQEYAVGDSLDVVLRDRGTMEMADVAALAGSLAGALHHAAGRGVHHGLLHPRDILMAADTVRITGFGIAAALKKVGATLPTRLQYGSAVAAPDAYALRAIAFELATGRRATAESVKAFELPAGLKASTTDVTDNAVVVPPFRLAADAHDLHDPIDNPLDREIDPGPRDFELDEPPPPFPASWAAQPPRAWQVSDGQSEPPGRRWPVAVMFLVFAILAALSVGLFLRSPRPTPVAEHEPAVDETIVDLPAAAAPAVNAPIAPVAPDVPVARIASVAPGRLLIRSTPAEADVFVNGKPRGKTPLALRDLALGSYTIRVARNGYAAEERTLRLDARRPTTSTTFSLRATSGPGLPATAMGRAGATAGVLNVQSRPAGARVYINDRLAGATPMIIPGLPAGPATVRIEMDGYRLWTTRVHVNAGEQTRVAASLERP